MFDDVSTGTAHAALAVLTLLYSSEHHYGILAAGYKLVKLRALRTLRKVSSDW